MKRAHWVLGNRLQAHVLVLKESGNSHQSLFLCDFQLNDYLKQQLSKCGSVTSSNLLEIQMPGAHPRTSEGGAQ